MRQEGGIKQLKTHVKHVVAAAATALTLGLTGTAGSAEAAPATYSLSAVQFDTPKTITAPGAAGATCKINQRVVTRDQQCLRVKARVDLLRNGRPVGHAEFEVSHTMKLNLSKRTWSEQFHVGRATLVNASGVKMSVSAKAGGTAKASLSFPQGHTLGAPVDGKVSYNDTVGKRRQNLAHTTYKYTFSKPGVTPGGFSYQSANFRCDDKFWSKDGRSRTKAPGCVFPTAPTEISMVGLPGISKGIRDLRARGGHLGDPNGGRPLHMITDEGTATRNRAAVCDGQTPPDWGPVPPPDRPSCDEYPFATTSEGGTHVPAAQRTTTWVRVQENNVQGGRITAFKKKFRMLDGDPFYVAA
ncbi:NucA/NucB deoxyribonuclease domain-containing protein [Streptomyces sp. NPDC003710]